MRVERQQDAGDFAMLMLRFALDLRPDLTAARLMAAEILTSQDHPDFALQMLAPVADNDPIGAPARLQRRDALILKNELKKLFEAAKT